MATDKELLQKLFKIAENQQKIIKKLAQSVAAPEAAPQAGQFTPAQFQAAVNSLARMAKVDSTVQVAYVNDAPGVQLTVGVQSSDTMAADKMNEAVGKAKSAVLSVFSKAAGQNVVNVTFNQS